MKMTQICKSQWYEKGVKFVNGQFQIYEFPPTPLFCHGVAAGLAANLASWIWSDPNHKIWAELGSRVGKREIEISEFGSSDETKITSELFWQYVMQASPDTCEMVHKTVASPHAYRYTSAKPLTRLCHMPGRR